jgi:hypothetical protein
MRKTFALLIIALILPFGVIRAQEPVANPDDVSAENPDLSYRFIAEFGFAGGYPTFMFTGVLINSVSFKDKDLIGLGVGTDFEINSNFSFPIFANYRHYFQSSGKNLIPMVNIAAGVRIEVAQVNIQYLYPYINPWDYFVSYNIIHKQSNICSAGAYVTLEGGFTYKLFTLAGGYFLRSGYYGISSGVEFKIGLTF